MGRTDLLPSVWHEVARVADGGGHAVVCGGRGWQTMLERPTSGDGEGGRAQWCANSVCCPGPGAADGCAIRDWEAQQGQKAAAVDRFSLSHRKCWRGSCFA